MRTDFPTEALESAWGPARAAGVVGSAPVNEVREHTAGFLSAVCSVFPADTPLLALDVGSGAGIPGLLLAWELPASRWTLLDSTLRRCELAEAAVTAVGISDRVRVVHGRADELLADVPRGTMDLVTARLLGKASETLELCAPYCRPGGLVVASIAGRDLPIWQRAAELPGISGLTFTEHQGGGFVAFRVGSALRAGLPRRPKARSRTPLLGS